MEDTKHGRYQGNIRCFEEASPLAICWQGSVALLNYQERQYIGIAEADYTSTLVGGWICSRAYRNYMLTYHMEVDKQNYTKLN